MLEPALNNDFHGENETAKVNTGKTVKPAFHRVGKNRLMLIGLILFLPISTSIYSGLQSVKQHSEPAQATVETQIETPLDLARADLLREIGAGEEDVITVLAIAYIQSAEQVSREPIEYQGQMMRVVPDRWLRRQLNDRSYDLAKLRDRHVLWSADEARQVSALMLEIKALDVAIAAVDSGQIPTVAPDIQVERIQNTVEMYRGILNNASQQ